MDPSGPSLPTELLIRVLDYLHHDSESLSACARVCREWVYLSRCHLFASLTVMLHPPSSGDSAILPRSLVELTSGTSVGCSYIQTLSIRTPFSDDGALKPGTIQGSSLGHLMQKLHNLRSLQLVDLDVTAVEGPLEVPLVSLNSLELTFEGRVERPVAAAITALSLFENIRDLKITVEYLGRNEKLIPPLPIQHIGDLTLKGSLLGIRALRETLHPDSTITSLSLCPHLGDWSEVIDLGLIIRNVSSQLVSLTLTPGLAMVYCWETIGTRKTISLYLVSIQAFLIILLVPTRTQWQTLNLLECSALDSVTFILDEVGFYRAFAEYAAESLLDVLSYVPSTVRAINFQVGRRSLSCITVAESMFGSEENMSFWQQLNEMLSNLPRLCQIEFWFVIEEDRYKATWRESIEKHMPSYHAKGLVSFRFRFDLAPRQTVGS